MLADPKATPVTVGVPELVVAPPGMMNPDGLTVTFEVSLLLKVTKRPPGGAGLPNVTGNAADLPKPTMTPAGNWIPSELVSEKFAGASASADACTV
jgi:hypothetical protein